MTALAQWVLAALLSLPRFHLDSETTEERTARLEIISNGIDDAASRATCTGSYKEDKDCKTIWTGSKKELAGLLITQGFFESRFAEHVHEDRCRTGIGECDHGRAKSVWQLHTGSQLSVEQWRALSGTTPESTKAAAWAATQALSRAKTRCGSTLGAISLYATGRTCAWSQAPVRLKFLEKILRTE
jgi:hypothetical protein